MLKPLASDRTTQHASHAIIKTLQESLTDLVLIGVDIFTKIKFPNIFFLSD